MDWGYVRLVWWTVHGWHREMISAAKNALHYHFSIIWRLCSDTSFQEYRNFWFKRCHHVALQLNMTAQRRSWYDYSSKCNNKRNVETWQWQTLAAWNRVNTSGIEHHSRLSKLQPHTHLPTHVCHALKQCFHPQMINNFHLLSYPRHQIAIHAFALFNVPPIFRARSKERKPAIAGWNSYLSLPLEYDT